MKKRNIGLQDVVPFAAFVIIFAFFEIASKGKMLSPFSLQMMLDQSVMTIVSGCGVPFVVAMGSIDLSVGVNLALSGVLAVWAANAAGGALLVPVALLTGLLVGLFNGVIVARFKVPSFMLSIAMLIGIRGIVNFIQTNIGTQFIPEATRVFAEGYIRYPLFFVIVAVMWYVLEYTRFGKYCKAIGENETMAKFVGVPVERVKVLAFALSGLMAGFAALFSVTSVGGTTQQMGVFFEMKVAMAIFLGGVLVTGGFSAKLYKVLLGSFSITIIVNGLALIGLSETQYSQSFQGLLLLIILGVTILASSRRRKVPSTLDEEEPDPVANESRGK